MKPQSMTRRLIVSILTVELLCALAFIGAELLHERRVRLHAFDVTLQGRSDSLLGAIQDAEDPDDNVTIDPTELRLPEEDIYAVYNQGGRSLGTSQSAPDALTERQGDGYRSQRLHGHHYRVFERQGMRIIDRAENAGVGLRRPVTIVYAAADDHLWHEILEGASFSVIVSALLVAGTGIAMILLVRRALRPISELAQAASAVSAPSLKFERPASAMELLELRPLADTLATTIDGLRLAFEQQHRFVGDAAHELKTAVAVERSSAQLLMMTPRSSEEYLDGLHRVLEDNARVDELVTRMLTLARMEERASMRRDSCTDFGVETAKCVERLQSFATVHDVRLHARLAESARVSLSPEDAEVLVSNLVVNAVQHSSAASSVVVSMHESDGAVVLTVADEGRGISPVALPHVFERFYREDASRSRQTGGVGLGLAICKSIVDGCQGSIEMISAPGKGTTVRVTLPQA